MQINIAQRRCEVPPAVLERAEAELPRLTRFEPRLGKAELVFSEERHVRFAEGILSVDGFEPVVAKGQGSDFRAALDSLLARLSKILRRHRERIVAHRGPSEPQPETE